jgi:hypothetical protein
MGDDSGAGACNTILQLIQLGITIACVVLISRIYNKTGENPLEIYDTSGSVPGDNNGLSNYANKVDYASALSSSKYCQCEGKIWNNICTEEQIISGCFDVSESSSRHFLRNLGMNCDSYNQEILSQGGAYSKVFDLGFNMVHKMALGIMIILIAVLASIGISLIAALGTICCGEGAALLIAPCAICIILVGLFAGLVNFILFIILMVNYYKGKTTGEFLDYYETCLEPTSQQLLKGAYDKLHSLDSNMTAFVTLNFIQLFLGYIASCLGFNNKEKN